MWSRQCSRPWLTWCWRSYLAAAECCMQSAPGFSSTNEITSFLSSADTCSLSAPSRHRDPLWMGFMMKCGPMHWAGKPPTDSRVWTNSLMVVEDANSVVHIFQIVHYRHLIQHQHNTGNVIKLCLDGLDHLTLWVLLHVSAYFFSKSNKHTVLFEYIFPVTPVPASNRNKPEVLSVVIITVGCIGFLTCCAGEKQMTAAHKSWEAHKHRW